MITSNSDYRDYSRNMNVLSGMGQSGAKTMGQMVRNFGTLPPASYTASTPGPMKGGAPMILGRQFTHGVMW